MVHEQVQGQVAQGLRELERRVLTAKTRRFKGYEERLAQLEHLSRERPSWNEWEERLEAVEGALPSSSLSFIESPPPVPESRIARDRSHLYQVSIPRIVERSKWTGGPPGGTLGDPPPQVGLDAKPTSERSGRISPHGSAASSGQGEFPSIFTI